MNRKNIEDTPPFFLRGREKERQVSLNPYQREKRTVSHSPFKGGARRGVLVAILVAFAILAVAILVACPAAPSVGGGTGTGNSTDPDHSSNCGLGASIWSKNR